MNTNPNAKRILCFGDSNTFGIIPGTKERFEVNVRWTGVLQNLLGNDYEIIEEGLGGRTTNIDDPFPGYEDKNGLEYLFPCIRSQVPLDLVILMIGKNDFKKVFDREAKDVAIAVRSLVAVIKEYSFSKNGDTKIMILAPAPILNVVEKVKPHFAGAPEKSKKIADALKKIAEEENCDFFDISKVVRASEIDGLHLDDIQHKILAEELFNRIKNGQNNHR